MPETLTLNLQNFTSLFEVFTALNVLYTIIDDDARSKLSSIESTLSEFQSQVNARQVSLSHFATLDKTLLDDGRRILTEGKKYFRHIANRD
jgi:hypothetical protein